MGRRGRLWRAVPAALAAAVLIVPQAGAYHGVGPRWPGGVVPYFNAAPDQAWALGRAIAAWNASGANVRFVAVPRSQARLIIRHDPASLVAACREAFATVGDVPGAAIEIGRLDDASPTCNRFQAAVLLAHELGHVLGLEHETAGCALMNPYLNLWGGSLCPHGLAWQWRCGMVMPDDAAGAVALYGGAVPGRLGRLCPMVAYPPPPASLSLRLNSKAGTVALSFERSPTPQAPLFLRTLASGTPGWTLAIARGACPAAAAVSPLPLYLWPAGERRDSVTEALPSLPGRYCYAVWSVDGLGRVGPVARVAWLTVRA